MSRYYPDIPWQCGNCGSEEIETQDCTVLCYDCGWQKEVQERLYCGDCDHDFTVLDISELTSFEDHGKCHSCAHSA